MNASTKKYAAIALLSAAVLGFLYVQLAPVLSSSGGNTSDSGHHSNLGSTSQNSPSTTEPSFVLEGYGSFLDGADTLATFRLELAESPQEQAQGIMWRKHMDPDMGMLFLMPEEQMQSFWMKNTYIPLDIIYLTESGKVVSIQANAQPFNETPLPSEGPAKLVLELRGGTCASMGILPNMTLVWNRL